MVVRILASAYDAPSAWDLKCDVREELLAWLQAEHPESLPVQRIVLDGPPAPDGIRWEAAWPGDGDPEVSRAGPVKRQ